MSGRRYWRLQAVLDALNFSSRRFAPFGGDDTIGSEQGEFVRVLPTCDAMTHGSDESMFVQPRTGAAPKR